MLVTLFKFGQVGDNAYRITIERFDEQFRDGENVNTAVAWTVFATREMRGDQHVFCHVQKTCMEAVMLSQHPLS